MPRSADFEAPQSYRRHTLMLVVSFTVVAFVIAFWNARLWYSDRLNEYQKLVEFSVAGASREVLHELNALRKEVSLLAQGEQDLLVEIIKNPDDIAPYSQLQRRVKAVFPDAVAVTIADTEGRPYIDDFDGFIVDACKADIRRYAMEHDSPKVVIHPNPLAYHFDIMVRTHLPGHRAVFFVSFKPEVISRLLVNSQLYEHQLVLIRQDPLGLIEVTTSGTRNGENEEDLILSKDELERIAYRLPIEGTQWLLVDIPNSSPAADIALEIWKVFVFAALVTVILGGVLYRQLRRSEIHILDQNKTLQQHAHALENNEARLSRAQEIASMGHWDFNLATDEIRLSDGVLRMFALSPRGTFRPNDVLQVICPAERNKVKHAILRAIIRQRPCRMEISVCRSDGETRVLDASAELCQDVEGNPLQVFGIVQDITERKRAEHTMREASLARALAEQSSNAKGAFLANMSHEIRTPLTAIIGFGETLLDSNQSMEERQSSIRTIIRNGKHLLQIVNDVLDLSKIEAKALQIDYGPLAPMELVREVEDMARPQAEERGLQLVVEQKTPLPRTLVSDPLRLKQVLLNLCSNAIKFTKSGEVRIEVSCNRSNNELTIAIVDTGIGMTPEQLQRVFEPFTQADATTTRRYGGTGLGLSISRQLAELLNGSLVAFSRMGTGSRFVLTLPAGVSSNTEWVEPQESSHKRTLVGVYSATPLFTGKVLLAEDTPDNRRLLQHYLKRVGVSVDTAENGAVALELADRTRYDLIIMDVQMPVMDGIEATRRLRSRGYDGAIVALTANAMKDDQDLCLAAGCNEFLTKPISRNRLYETLANYLPQSDIKAHQSAVVSLLLKDEPELADMVDNFVRNLPGFIQSIKDAMLASNHDQLAKAAHDIKGVGGNFGFPALAEIGAQLQFQACAKNDPEIHMLFEELKVMGERIRAGVAK